MTDYDILVMAAEKMHNMDPRKKPEEYPTPVQMAALTFERCRSLGFNADAVYLRMGNSIRV